ncbi:MAG: hypothetical protein K2X81_04165 [Candidatus Obscuribacterales bacterium]|nr:hypothetical protein [Candidatus Obscuribacterales bacterium]
MTGSATNLLIFEAALQERQPVATRLLSAALGRKALSNAYLITGRAVADKWLIAKQLTAFLNCLYRKEDEYFSCLSKDSEQAACQNCSWIQAGEHPQAWIVLEGQGESGKIPVEKARLLTEEMHKTSRYMRVVLIPQAEQEYLHPAPANALLKSIEEPQENSLFILLASSTEQVLPTIVSRTQVIPLICQFKTGLWLESKGESADLLAEKLAAIKSEFIHSARKRLSGTSSLHGSYIKAVSESQELSDRLLNLSEDEGVEADRLMDVLLAAELEVLRESSSKNPSLSKYLSKLAELTEQSKQQLDHYVRKNNVLETFAYSLTELRAKYLGDFCLAKS